MRASKNTRVLKAPLKVHYTLEYQFSHIQLKVKNIYPMLISPWNWHSYWLLKILYAGTTLLESNLAITSRHKKYSCSFLIILFLGNYPMKISQNMEKAIAYF